ncbi:MAG: hypothetical protein RMX65_030185 [Nostoc sp. DedQUE01]|nr:hypothetical protein [Nostoc sp. DedQUE01]
MKCFSPLHIPLCNWAWGIGNAELVVKAISVNQSTAAVGFDTSTGYFDYAQYKSVHRFA